ncbi:hypothetical protein [Macrococcus armenti]|nr:hypothetical protein [Macrococcus armenti]
MKSKQYSTKQIHSIINYVFNSTIGNKEDIKERLLEEFKYQEAKR